MEAKEEESIPQELLDKELDIVKSVDKKLFSERIAIEVKAHLDCYGEGHPVFESYLLTGKDCLNYSNIELREILDLSKEVLNVKYNIKVISENPFNCIKE